MVVVISLCSSSSNLLFWDLILHQRAQRLLGRGSWADSETNSLIRTDAGKPDQVVWIHRSILAVFGGNLGDANLSIREKRETWLFL